MKTFMWIGAVIMLVMAFFATGFLQIAACAILLGAVVGVALPHITEYSAPMVMMGGIVLTGALMVSLFYFSGVAQVFFLIAFGAYLIAIIELRHLWWSKDYLSLK